LYPTAPLDYPLMILPVSAAFLAGVPFSTVFIDVLLVGREDGSTKNATVKLKARMSEDTALLSDRFYELAVVSGARKLRIPANCTYRPMKCPLPAMGNKYSIIYFIGAAVDEGVEDEKHEEDEEDEGDEFDGFIDPDTGLDANGNPA
jgi:hypothetical protein